jgi:hypothetical protein
MDSVGKHPTDISVIIAFKKKCICFNRFLSKFALLQYFVTVLLFRMYVLGQQRANCSLFLPVPKIYNCTLFGSWHLCVLCTCVLCDASIYKACLSSQPIASLPQSLYPIQLPNS